MPKKYPKMTPKGSKMDGEIEPECIPKSWKNGYKIRCRKRMEKVLKKHEKWSRQTLKNLGFPKEKHTFYKITHFWKYLKNLQKYHQKCIRNASKNLQKKDTKSTCQKVPENDAKMTEKWSNMEPKRLPKSPKIKKNGVPERASKKLKKTWKNLPGAEAFGRTNRAGNIIRATQPTDQPTNWLSEWSL